MSNWFREWRGPLRKFLLNKGAAPVADLDDIAQEVFLRLMRYERAELVEYPQAYLFKMAANVAAEWAIRARHRHPHEPIWLVGLISEDDPDQSLDHATVQEEIERAINTLSPREREILKLRFSEGLGKAQIALRLGCTERIVKRCLAKCYEKPRLELDTELMGVSADGRG